MSEEYAFPNISTEKDESGFPVATTEQQGMTLRDWFAGMALQGMLRLFDDGKCVATLTAARFSFNIADAMMEERKKRNEKREILEQV